MQKWARILSAVVMISMPLLAQNKNASPKVVPKISESYAKAALLAILATRSDVSAPVRKDLQTLTATGTQDKINNADVEAKTPDEQHLTEAIRAIYSVKLQHNAKRNEASGDGAALRSRGIVMAEQADKACLDALESSLRARSTEIPQECKDEIGTAEIKN